MPSFRATVRWSTDRQHYHVEDIEAPDLAAALELLGARLPHEIGARADLVELRLQPDPEAREFGPG